MWYMPCMNVQLVWGVSCNTYTDTARYFMYKIDLHIYKFHMAQFTQQRIKVYF